jgi:tetratricopeptide (TPR) repeat protein
MATVLSPHNRVSPLPAVPTMFRSFLSLCLAVLSALGVQTAQAADSSPQEQRLVVKPGDLLVQPDGKNWVAVKILEVDSWPDGIVTAHCLTYQPLSSKPTIDSLQQVKVRVWHAPIAAGSFAKGWERIGNRPATQEELVGFVEYLKLTDFPRYISFTGHDSKEIVRKANEHYKRAYYLGEQGNRTEAIAEYSKAIDLFPLFYEALDNRAFTYMELGKLREALLDFEQSLKVNPNGMTAFFSKGECLMKLGDLTAAEAIFKEGQRRFPEQRATFTKYLERVRALQRKG